MDIQRLRNLTTGRLHTKMADIVYYNPIDQPDAGGAHWWRKPGTETLAEIEGEA